jgi:hypothetical protein
MFVSIKNGLVQEKVNNFQYENSFNFSFKMEIPLCNSLPVQIFLRALPLLFDE